MIFNLQLWIQISINIIQCNLAKADPSPGLAKCNNVKDTRGQYFILGNILVKILNISGYTVTGTTNLRHKIYASKKDHNKNTRTFCNDTNNKFIYVSLDAQGLMTILFHRAKFSILAL